MPEIQSSSLLAAKNAGTISTGAQALQSQTISIDSQSTISAKENSANTFSNSQAQKENYRSVLEQDAKHIKTLGIAFDELDESISRMLCSGF